MQIIVDRGNRLLHVDLSGFTSKVNLSQDFSVFHHASGVKPSANIWLGYLWGIPSGNYGKQARWMVNGDVAVVGGMNSGNRFLHTPKTLPIPDGVDFA